MFQDPCCPREDAPDQGMDIMRMFLCGLAATFACFFAIATPAAAETVNCPLTEARRSITNTLPSGWRQTPVVSRLTETRVDNVGGELTMVCQYSAAGAVLREVPAGQTCVARTGGFECGPSGSPPPTPTSESHASGTFTVRGTYNIDFDTGAETPRPAADFWYEVIRSGESYLTSRNGARLSIMSATEPGYSGCTAATYTDARTRIETITAGRWICVRTSEGRIGEFRIESIDRFSAPSRMTMRFTTWR